MRSAARPNHDRPTETACLTEWGWKGRACQQQWGWYAWSRRYQQSMAAADYERDVVTFYVRNKAPMAGQAGASGKIGRSWPTPEAARSLIWHYIGKAG